MGIRRWVPRWLAALAAVTLGRRLVAAGLFVRQALANRRSVVRQARARWETYADREARRERFQRYADRELSREMMSRAAG